MTGKFLLDRSYVINMDKDVKRLAEFDFMMKKCEWNYVRFPAVEPNKMTAHHLKMQEEYLSPAHTLRRGEICCLLSHISLWVDAHENQYDRVAIFEDDARVLTANPSIKEPIEELYAYLQANNIEEPDILYLGKCCDYCKKLKRVYGNVYYSVRPICAHAYILSKKGIEKLLKLGPYVRPLDMKVADAIAQGDLRVMVFQPSLFFQDVIDTESNLRPSNQSFLNICECCDVTTETSYYWIAISSLLLLILILVILWYFVYPLLGV